MCVDVAVRNARHANLVPIDREEAIVQVVLLGDVLPGQKGARRHEIQARQQRTMIVPC